MQPWLYSGTSCFVSSSSTASTETKQDPPGRVSHVPFCKLPGQWPSQ